MPRMDGITFLRKLMAQHPMPVVMCSSLTEEGSETLMQALEAGAVDVILKPRVDTRQQLLEARDAHLRRGQGRRRSAPGAAAAPAAAHLTAPEPKLTADVMMPPPRGRRAWPRTTEKVVCIGASTGGTESLRAVLEALPAGRAGHRHRPAHAREVHRRLRPPARLPVRGQRQGGRRMAMPCCAAGC